MSVDYQRVKAIFMEAQARPEGERAAFLAAACGDDRPLLEEVASLLDFDLEASLLDAAAPPLPPGEAPHQPPAQLGAYRLLQEIGRGGMGVVYEAEQDSPQRRVAVKILDREHAPLGALRRFENEARTLGRLEHPGIARIYEASVWTEDGVTWPFFAMELIEGAPIDAHVRDHDVGLERCLELVAKVCDAVEYAHQNGVIHRDLKPANILVTRSDGLDLPRVLDFGVARVMDQQSQDGLQTNTGQIIGTPQYMSPEQIGGIEAVDTRSDVYALGLILYELLAGEVPYEARGVSLGDAARTICEVDPPRLGRTDRRYRGDVETIVAKALEKDRARRYGSVAELARDLRAVLNDEPIRAVPPTTLYLLSKLARRRRGLTAAIATASLTLTLGAAGSTYGFLEARRERDAKQAALSEEARAREVSDAVTAFLVDMMKSGRPDQAGRDVTLRKVIEASESKIEARFAEKPEVKAKLHATLGRSYIELGDYALALKHAQEAVALWSRTRGDSAEETLDARVMITELQYFSGDLPAAHAAAVEVLEGRRAHPNPSPDQLVEAIGNVGFMLTRMGRHDEALATFREALPLVEASDFDAPDIEHDLRLNLGVLYIMMERYADAEQVFSALLPTAVERYGPRHPKTLLVRSTLASALLREERWAEARPVLEETLAGQREVLGPTHSKTLITLHNLATAVSNLDSPAAALPMLEEGMKLSVETYGETSPSATLYLESRSRAWREAKRFAEAERNLQADLRRFEAEHGAVHLLSLMMRVELIRLRLAEGQPARAAPHVRVLERALARDDVELKTETRSKWTHLVARARAAMP